MGKDSAKVVNFLSLLARLKDCCDDDPECLRGLAKEDEGVKDLCDRLHWAAFEVNERRHRQLFAALVDPKFLVAWRDFEERFEKTVMGIVFDFSLRGLESTDSGHTTEADSHWEDADYEGDQQARTIESAIEFAHEQATDEWRDFGDGFREKIEDARDAWQWLKQNAGFDLRGVFRRKSYLAEEFGPEGNS
jgi:hypothetical protein